MGREAVFKGEDLGAGSLSGRAGRGLGAPSGRGDLHPSPSLPAGETRGPGEPPAVTAGQPRLLQTVPELLGGHVVVLGWPCPIVWRSALKLTGPGTSGRLSPLRSLAWPTDPPAPPAKWVPADGAAEGGRGRTAPHPRLPPNSIPAGRGERTHSLWGAGHLSAGSRSPSRPPLPPLSPAGHPLANPWAGASEVWLESQPHLSRAPWGRARRACLVWG